MLVAVISDVHANLVALDAVLEDIENKAADVILCAGDLVGYGASPNECCDRIHKVARHVVRGNHDEAALTGDVSGMNRFAAEAALWTSRSLGPSSIDYLSTLPIGVSVELSGRRFAIYHGSVGSTTEYVYKEGISPELIDRAKADVLILGHTHVPYFLRLEKGVVVNPGSVGQPRDHNPKASYATIELPEMRCEIHRLGYEIDRAAEDIERAGLPEFLGERLRHGR